MIDLASLKQIFDTENPVSLGVVQRVEIASDRSFVRALVRELPDQNEVVAYFAFSHSSQGNGFFALPSSQDFVIMVRCNEEEDLRIIAYGSSKDDPVPAQLSDGDAVLKAAKKLHVAGATGVFLGLGDPNAEPDEPIPLGNVLLSCLSDLYTRLDNILSLIQTGPIGVDSMGGNVITHPTLATALDAVTGERKELADDKDEYITDTDTNIVSQITYTERGT